MPSVPLNMQTADNGIQLAVGTDFLAHLLNPLHCLLLCFVLFFLGKQ